MTPPSLTRTWHRDTYRSIDPRRRQELALTGKTIVISGGGSGIGKAFGKAFADAKAARVAIIGRRRDVLDTTKREIEANHPAISIGVYPADVADIRSIEHLALDIGPWDVLISNAGYLPNLELLQASEPNDWWRGFEVNVRGTYNLLRSFLPTRKAHACLIGVSAGSIQVQALAPRFSSYNASKLAAVKLLESVAAETPDLHVVSMHPGVVESDMSAKSSQGKEKDSIAMDTPELAGHFGVWLCSPEARFLRGRFVWSNWDVVELQARQEEIKDSLLLTANCIGWPYSP